MAACRSESFDPSEPYIRDLTMLLDGLAGLASRDLIWFKDATWHIARRIITDASLFPGGPTPSIGLAAIDAKEKKVLFATSFALNEVRSSTQRLEVLAMAIAADAWGGRWRDELVRFDSDATAAVNAVNAERAKRQSTRRLLRIMFDAAARCMFVLMAEWLPREWNDLADAVSKCRSAAAVRAVLHARSLGDWTVEEVDLPAFYAKHRIVPT